MKYPRERDREIERVVSSVFEASNARLMRRWIIPRGSRPPPLVFVSLGSFRWPPVSRAAQIYEAHRGDPGNEPIRLNSWSSGRFVRRHTRSCAARRLGNRATRRSVDSRVIRASLQGGGVDFPISPHKATVPPFCSPRFYRCFHETFRLTRCG